MNSHAVRPNLPTLILAGAILTLAGVLHFGPSLSRAERSLSTPTAAVSGQTKAPAAKATAAPINPDDRAIAQSLSNAFQHAAARVEPSVVHITTESDRIARDFFGRRVRQHASGTGSGMIVTEDGYILTNNHVVANASQLFAKLADGRTLPATIVGTDELRDLAVVKIDADNLTPIEFGDSDELKIGQWVLAVGSPFGFDQTVTAGIISAKGRGLGIVDGDYKDAEEFIQTDAAINPGNSGGPLINLDGQVVGINSAIFSRSGGSIGLGFSIPINLAQVVYENIIRGGRVDFGYLGVRLDDSSGHLVIAEVIDGSPADKAGLRKGDIILQYRDKPVKNATQLLRSIQFTPPGADAPIVIKRRNKTLNLTAHIAARTEAEVAQFGGRELRSIGMTVITGTPSRMGIGSSDTPIGAQVIDVEPNSPADAAGFQRGDLIVAVNGEPVKDIESFVALLAEQGPRVRIDLKRGKLSGYTYLER